MNSISIVADIEEIDNAFGEDSPFRLKKDAKYHNLKQKDLDNMAEAISDEIQQGFDRTACVVIFWTETRKGNYCKIRVANEEKNSGKSGGYRCVVLWDNIAKEGFLLHIFEHKDKDNLTAVEKKALKNLVCQYILNRYKEL